MDIDGGSGIPDAVPANTDETGENTTQVTFPNAGEATVPAQTDPQESPVAEKLPECADRWKIQESAESESPSETQLPGV